MGHTTIISRKFIDYQMNLSEHGRDARNSRAPREQDVMNRIEAISSAGVAPRRSAGASMMGTAASGAIALALLLDAGSALAQADVAPQQGNAPSASNEAIVVTGSRIVRRDFSSSTPIVTVGQELLTQTADFAIESSLQQLPQFAASTTSQFNAGLVSVGASTLNLRNMGDNRNLVLLDGRRLQPSTSNFSIDVNAIPASLIENVEVITGGASAVYGSDAISGVINFRLKRNFEGVRIDAQQGITQHGDAPNTNVTLTLGGNFAENRGNAVLVVDYSKRGTFQQRDREFYRRGWASGMSSSNFLAQGYFRPVAGNMPDQAVVDSYFGQFGAAPGAVTNLTDLGFNGDDSLFNVRGSNIYNFTSMRLPYQNVAQLSPTSRAVVEYPFVDATLSVPLERLSVFSRLNYEIDDNINVYMQGYYTHYDSTTEGGPGQLANTHAILIPRDGAHPVPAALAAILDSRPDPTAPWMLNKSTLDIGNRVNSNKNDVFQVLAGVNGNIPGLSDWTYDLNASWGRSQLISTGVSGFIRTSLTQQLYNAPNYGAGYSDPAGTCTSGLDPFGFSRPSQDCIDYISAHPANTTELKQQTVELNLQGKLFDLPAGEVRTAIGAGYRRNTFSFKPDDLLRVPISSQGHVDLSGTYVVEPAEGVVSVKEVYGELLVPLLRDSFIGRSLEASLGYRYSDYSMTGGVHAYKADLIWAPVDALRVRGGYQRAVRAPNVNELFQPPTSVLASPQDPCNSTVNLPWANHPGNPDRAQMQALCRAMMSTGAPPVLDPVNDPTGLNNYVGSDKSVPSVVAGNPALGAEKADTYTAGIVFQPRWALPLDTRLSISVDWYKIDLKDAISYVSAQAAYDFCFNANGTTNPTYDPNYVYCRFIERDDRPGSLGVPNRVSVTYQNQGTLKTEGVDFQIDLNSQIGPGRFRINSLINHIRTFTTQIVEGAEEYEYAGHSGGGVGQSASFFHWKMFNTFSYEVGALTMGLRWQHLGAVRNVAKVTAPTSTLPDVAAYNLFDLFGAVEINENVRFRGGVSNLFDKQPPVTGANIATTNPYDYDIIGRRFYVGASITF